MEHTIHTLQEFMMHTKAVAYVLAGAYLISIVAYFRFLFMGILSEDEDKHE